MLGNFWTGGMAVEDRPRLSGCCASLGSGVSSINTCAQDGPAKVR
jgi:hypothetical protein